MPKTVKAKRQAKARRESKKREEPKDIFCKNCAYFHDTFVECRRYAPRPRFEAEGARDSEFLIEANKDNGDGDDNYNAPLWPSVREHDWCGDFAERE